MTSKVDVILTSYNRTWLLNDAITSVLAQTMPDFTLHIIDDGSKQETIDIIEFYAKRDRRIKYMQTYKKDKDRRKVCDYCVNINRVLRYSSSPYISYLTCDDVYYPMHLAALSERLDWNDTNDIVFGDQAVVKLNDTTGERQLLYYRNLPKQVASAANNIDHNMFMMRRYLLNIVGYWPTDAAIYGAGDGAYFEQIKEHNIIFYNIGHVTSEHRIHADSIQGRDLWPDLT